MLSNLKPTESGIVDTYLPYYQQSQKRQILPLAISLYQSGILEGERKIEGGELILFTATWTISNRPVDLTRCRMDFPDHDLCYEMILPNNEFIDLLIDIILNYKKNQTIDFPQLFYYRLLGKKMGNPK
ncbi:MAG: hypothetical protein VKL00_09025 [Synechococcales bacterium]|nr:hypothetical protein [Cyanobacteria bacterium REEB444]MEB3125750.1 hypothetical protein [Synechococcales bacterium]